MEKLYEKLSLEFENAVFRFQDIKYTGLGSTYMLVSTYDVEFYYKGYHIISSQELGNSNMGRIIVCLNNKIVPDFTIETIDHFTNLFLRSKSLLKIKCKRESFKKILFDAAVSSRLNEIINKNSLEPKIYTENKGNMHYIKTDYSLQFEDKIGGLRALLNFYKILIDHV